METTAPPAKFDDVEGAVPAVEMADVYRSLVTNLRDKLGGTINDANADAIACAAAQVYREEVEPRLWEEKSAHELLDGLGVPRSGAFVPYSLSDRLLLLRRSGADGVYRAQAHQLLDELAVPRLDDAGRGHSLQARLTLLLSSFGGVPGRGEAPNPGEAGDPGGDTDGDADGGDADGGARGTDETPAGPDLVDALETIHQAVGPAGGEDAVSSPPPAPAPPPSPAAPDLIGLGSLLGGIQEELVEVRQAVESLRREVRDAVALFQAAGGAGRAAPVVPGVGLTGEGPEIVVRRLSGAAEAGAAEPVSSERAAAGAGADFVPPGSASPNGEGHEGGPADTALGGPVDSGAPEPNRTPAEPSPAGRAGPHEPTRVLPSVPAPPYGQEAAEEPGAEEPAAPRRSRRFVLLFLVVILLGALLAAGIAAVTVFGWDELESRFLDTVTAPVWTGLGGLP